MRNRSRLWKNYRRGESTFGSKTKQLVYAGDLPDVRASYFMFYRPAGAPSTTVTQPITTEYPKSPEEVVEAYFVAVIQGRDSEAKKYLTTRCLDMIEEAMAESGSKTFKEVYEAWLKAEMGVSKDMERVETIGVRVWEPDEEVDVDYRLFFQDGTSLELDQRLIKEDGLWKIY